MYELVNSEEKKYLVVDEISEHQKDNGAIPILEEMTNRYNFNEKTNIMTSI